ncbi:MAG TPA: diacylglycerol kinase family protein [Allosphingosinicella sp.]|nr:diacylglycerol kinase family protein [Allosphingosinicella sp.]
MARVALLSNPRSTGNKALLPEVREFCARTKDIFHYEVEDVSQIGAALRTIARVKPKVLVINGGDGTVQATLTELNHGGHFGDRPPPVAVLPNGKTNLIALDLGAEGDPLTTLKKVLEIANGDMEGHIVSRELISLTDGSAGGKVVLGMFLGGAGLADAMLYCRHKIYPLGLPNAFSHALAVLAAIASIILGIRAAFLPPTPEPVKISVRKHGQLQGRFAFLMVTTLERLLLGGHSPKAGTSGGLQLMVVERQALTLVRALIATVRGTLGTTRVSGVHLERGDEIRIEGEHSSVILDGELFEAHRGHPIVLKPSSPVPFLKLAA